MKIQGGWSFQASSKNRRGESAITFFMFIYFSWARTPCADLLRQRCGPPSPAEKDSFARNFSSSRCGRGKGLKRQKPALGWLLWCFRVKKNLFSSKKAGQLWVIFPFLAFYRLKKRFFSGHISALPPFR
jgi:hypothetical protein